jgi:uncharacterized protein YbaR (Trm112 family)
MAKVTTMLNQQILDILVCPETKAALRPADDRLLARVNQAIARGDLKNRGGQLVSRNIPAGLLRADGQLLYPIVDEIPLLLVDEGILLDQLGGE